MSILNPVHDFINFTSSFPYHQNNLSFFIFSAYAVLRAAPMSVASPAPSNLQQTVIEEEDPVLPNPVHAAEANPIADVPSENPPASSPVDHPMEE